MLAPESVPGALSSEPG